MTKSMFGKTGMEISKVIFGGIIVMSEDQKDADRYVSYAIDNGVNYFDVAPTYGNAEERLGPALKPYRNKVFLACKTVERTAEEARKELHKSLKTLQTDYFDVYQLHAMSKPEDLKVFEENGVMQVLLQAQKEGLIRYISITSHNEDIALEAMSRYDFASVMFPVNWALSLLKGVGKQIENRCAANNTGFLGMKTLIHREWHEGEERPYPKSWCKPIYDNDKLGVAALKYTLSCNTNAVIPPGNIDHFKFTVSNIEECIKKPLTEEDITYMKSMLPNKEDLIFNEA